MSRDLYRDMQGALLAVIAGRVARFGLVVMAAGWIGYCARGSGKQEAKIVALTDTVRLTDSVAVVRTDTVVRVQRRVDTVRARSDALDSAVVIVNDSTITVPQTDSAKSDTSAQPGIQTVVIPTWVVADLRALRLTVATQDTLIASLYARDTTRLWQIESRDKLIREYSKRRPFACGKRCGFVVGLTAGILLHRAAK